MSFYILACIYYKILFGNRLLERPFQTEFEHATLPSKQPSNQHRWSEATEHCYLNDLNHNHFNILF